MDTRIISQWSPQLGPQTDLLTATWCEEILYGGARGGGKTDGILGDYFQDYQQYAQHWRGIMFRKTYPELEEVMGRAREMFEGHGEWQESKKTFQFWNGAWMRFRQLERNDDANKFKGHQYTWIGWEELDRWASAAPYNLLKACLRYTAAHVPCKRIRSSANPGGVGHGWIKEYFIDHNIHGYQPRADEKTKHRIMFIPAKVQDNKILMEADPGYADRLHGVGGPELVRAWLEGDWSVILGAYFNERPFHEMVLAPFQIPAHWPRFRAMDWGSYRPFCVQWWAVADGATKTTFSDGQVRTIPRGALICYREWYGASAANVGIKMHAAEVAAQLKTKQPADEKIAYSVADPSIWKEDGGPSIGEVFSNHGIVWARADNERIAGANQMRQRMRGDPESGRPMVYWFSTCTNSIRTIPTLQHDELRPEDVDTEGEDHPYDTGRYALMSRAMPYDSPVPITVRDIRKATLNEIFEIHEGSETDPRI